MTLNLPGALKPRSLPKTGAGPRPLPFVSFILFIFFDPWGSVEVKTGHGSGKAPVAARVNELCKLGIEMYKKMLASFVMHDAKDIGKQDEDNTKCARPCNCNFHLAPLTPST
jgi:hypothetical protein